MRVDLHIHSTYSDGICTPKEIVEIALRRDLAAISVTDHDCVDATEKAQAASGDSLEIVSGVELSSEFHGEDLHIIGYGVDPKDPDLREMLRLFRDTRLNRGLKIVENLRKVGISLDPDVILAKSSDGSLGRPHIAEALVENGYVKNFSEAFERYLGEHCSTYVKKYKLNPAEAIEYIRASGGLAFVAHPGIYLRDPDGLKELIALGFDGLEVYHPNHSESQSRQLKALAQEHDMLISGGSDYHGFAGKDVPIGEPEVPYEVWANIKRKLNEMRG